MKVALAQINPLVGDLKGNAETILSICKIATEKGVNLLLTPELSLWGYPPRDLLLNSHLLKKQEEILDELSKKIYFESPNLKALIGIAEPANDLLLPNLFNAIVLIEESKWKVIYRKQLLPTYDVFDEKRYFRPSNTLGTLNLEYFME